MKNNKFAKISLLILTVALCLVAIFAMSVSATEGTTNPTEKPEIYSYNISYSDKFSLMYAVDATNIAAGTPVTLYVSKTAPATPEAIKNDTNAQKYTISEITPKDDPATEEVEGVGLDVDAYVFTSAGIGATMFTTNFYAVVEVNDVCSDVARYSVAEYLYEMLSTYEQITDGQKALWEGAIAFGAGAQQAFGNMSAEDPNLLTNLRYVTVKGGTIDGYSTGVYPAGKELTITTDAVNPKWTVTSLKYGAAVKTETNQTAFTPTTDAYGFALKMFAYTEGYRDLDEFAPGDNIGSSTNNSQSFTSGGSAGKAWAYVEGHGTVYYASEIAAGKDITIDTTLNGKTYDEATSTAFEISFDIQMNTAEEADGHIRFTIGDVGGRRLYLDFYQRDENGAAKDTLAVKCYQTTLEDKEFAVDPNDWFHVKMVVYKDEPNYVYVYINGDETDPLKYGRDNKEVDFDNSPYFRFEGGGSAIDSCYLDNIFVGYTTEENPWSTTEAAE